MGATFEDYDAAVRAFWTGRDLQAEKQAMAGKTDAGTRGAVTGGGHLYAIHDVIAKEFEPLTELGAEVRRTGKISIPGHFRRAKDWDVVVTYKNQLIAAVECKSQVGSFGNNFNNRTEEAIGNAVDLWKAHEEGLIAGFRPWLGFVFVIEHAPGSIKVVRDQAKPVFKADPIFIDSSYIDRYQILFERLHKEHLYDAACLIQTQRGQGIFDAGELSVSIKNFSASIAGHVEYTRRLLMS